MAGAAVLALEDGSIFRGIAIGAEGSSSGEVVFNTSMTGYQEILTDPSYARQIVTLTYPHIGNTGTNQEDNESGNVWCSGLVIRDLPLMASSWRKQQTLNEFLTERNVVAIAEIDTRRLTRVLRDKGPLNGCLLSGAELESGGEALALERAKSFRAWTWQKKLLRPRVISGVAASGPSLRHTSRVLTIVLKLSPTTLV